MCQYGSPRRGPWRGRTPRGRLRLAHDHCALWTTAPFSTRRSVYSGRLTKMCRSPRSRGSQRQRSMFATMSASTKAERRAPSSAAIVRASSRPVAGSRRSRWNARSASATDVVERRGLHCRKPQALTQVRYARVIRAGADGRSREARRGHGRRRLAHRRELGPQGAVAGVRRLVVGENCRRVCRAGQRLDHLVGGRKTMFGVSIEDSRATAPVGRRGRRAHRRRPRPKSRELRLGERLGRGCCGGEGNRIASGSSPSPSAAARAGQHRPRPFGERAAVGPDRLELARRVEGRDRLPILPRHPHDAGRKGQRPCRRELAQRSGHGRIRELKRHHRVVGQWRWEQHLGHGRLGGHGGSLGVLFEASAGDAANGLGRPRGRALGDRRPQSADTVARKPEAPAMAGAGDALRMISSGGSNVRNRRRGGYPAAADPASDRRRRWSQERVAWRLRRPQARRAPTQWREHKGSPAMREA